MWPTPSPRRRSTAGSARKCARSPPNSPRRPRAGEHQLSATAGIFAANDTAATLLTFRGWALHDRTTLAFRRQPLPPLPEPIEYDQPRFTHPLLDVEPGFAHRPGYYAKLAWQPPVPVRIELFRYDNRADPEAVNEDMEWGWRTQFNHLGIVADLGGGNRPQVSGSYRTHADGLSSRTDGDLDRQSLPRGFRAGQPRLHQRRRCCPHRCVRQRQHGSLVAAESNETGWAATLAGHRDFGPVTAFVELLHVSSKRDFREEVGLAPRQRQTTLQAQLRAHW